MSDALYQECLTYLNIVGVNPHVVNTFAGVRRVYNLLQFFITWLLLVLELIIHWEGVVTLENDVELAFGICQIVMKTLTVHKMRLELIEILKQLNHFWPIDKFTGEIHDELEDCYAVTRKMFSTFRSFMLASVVAVSVKPFCLRERELPAKTFDICDFRNDFCYVLSYSWQVVNLTLMSISMAGFDGLFLVLLTRAYCQVKMIKYGLQKLDCDVGTQQLSELIDHHNFLLRFMRGMNAVYSNLLFVQFSSSLVLVCLVMFLFSIDGFTPDFYRIARYGPMLLMLLGQLYLYCAAGDRITQECEGVADAVYGCNWTAKYQPKLRKGICLVIQRAQVRTVLSAGGLFDLDMKTFMGVLQKSWSMYMAILQLKREETGDS